MEYTIWLLISVTIGFWVGVYVERKQWNNLIHAGKLPKPRGK